MILAQRTVAMLEQCCNHSKLCRNNVETLCCAKNRRCASSCVTSPYQELISYFLQFAKAIFSLRVHLPGLFQRSLHKTLEEFTWYCLCNLWVSNIGSRHKLPLHSQCSIKFSSWIFHHRKALTDYPQPVLFLISSTCKTEESLAKENSDPIFYLYAIYSSIYWPFYIQFLNVTYEPRLNSLLRFRTVFRWCPLFY